MRPFNGVLSTVPLLLARLVIAQGYGGALTFEGLDHFQLHSAASRALGEVTIAAKQDIGSMFNNPATLHWLRRIQLSVGGCGVSERLAQEQNYAPVRYYPNLSLLLEGLTGNIPDPNPELVGFTPADTVQRPFDNIGPNWSRSEQSWRPLHLLVAAPVTWGNIKLAAGAGAFAYADLHHFYQNNNVLSPAILSQRPLPTMRPTDDNPLAVDWYQARRSRQGTLWGYGIALAATSEKYHSSFGVSATFLRGRSDDLEEKVGRGRLTFFANAFRADSVGWRLSRSGSSEFRGRELTLSWMVTGRHVSMGVSAKPPCEVTRTYAMHVVSTALQDLYDVSLATEAPNQGQDRLRLPWRASVAISITPRERLMLSFEQGFRPYKLAHYVDPQGKKGSPWLPSSPFRVGCQYQAISWLALRAGLRDEAVVFEPEGNHIPGEAPTYSVYSCGAGVSYRNLRVDVAVESSLLKYQDIWSSAISKNSERRWVVMGQISYELGAGR